MRNTTLKKTSIIISFSTYLMLLPGCGQSENIELTNNSSDRVNPPSFDLGEVQNEFSVSSIADSGPGTLREAIQLANAAAGTDKIIFQSDGDLYKQPQSIYLESPLPEISDDLLIDGYIDEMLWKPSGVILDGQKKHQILKIAQNTKVKIKHLSFKHGNSNYGAAINSNGELIVDSSTFANNRAAKHGGAIISDNGQLIIYNSTFYQNSSTHQGGGVFCKSGDLSLTNNTFSENTANTGGALYSQCEIAASNNILANSASETDCFSTTVFDTPENSNIIESEAGCGVSFSNKDPLLTSLDYYNGPVQTMPFGQGSPAMNFGNNELAVNEHGEKLIWDQRGNGDPRYVLGFTDIGAFELQPILHPLIVDTLEDVDYRTCSVVSNDCSL
ncbi:MAG: right-handed parallel beta-helix repeat-containing protein, partial [Porticoccus sp.]